MSAASIVVLEEDGQPVLSYEEARDAINRVRQCVDIANAEIKRLYVGRAWIPLGYATWEALCADEFRDQQVRLAAPERREIVAELREAGMSTRAISAAIGVNRETVMNDIQVVGNQPPDDEIVDAEIVETPAPRVTGRDGKSYPGVRQGVGRHQIEAAEAKAARAAALAASGHTTTQIANELGYSARSTAVEFLKRHGIDVPADAVVGKQRNLDSTRIIAATVDAINGIGMLFDRIDYSALDPEDVNGWLSILNDSIRSLTTLRNRLKEVSQP